MQNEYGKGTTDGHDARRTEGDGDGAGHAGIHGETDSAMAVCEAREEH